MSNTTKQTTDWQTFKRILSLTNPFKKLFAISMFTGLLIAVISPVRPKLIQIAVDKYIMINDMNALTKITILIIAIVILEFFFRYAFGYYSSLLGQSVMKRLRTQLFDHVERLKLKFFDKTQVGIITTRTINDIETINNIFSDGFINLVTDILTLFFVIGMMFFESWKLTLVCLTVFPFLLIATYIFKEKVKSSFHLVRNKVAELNAFVQERISGMRIIQIFNAQDRELEKFKKINQEHYAANDKSVLYFSIFFPLVEIILAISFALMIWYGATLIMQQNIMGEEDLSVGIFAEFILLLNMAFRPMRMLADKFNTLQMGIIASERVFKLLDTQEIIEDKGTITTKEIKGDIAFKNVWFAYNDDDYVLKNINFQVNAGETLAIVGSTGSGKTSLINILNRFYEIQEGEILIDNINAKEYQLQTLRAYFGTVLQDVFLFSGSIYDNITLKNKNISKDKVIAAAKMVNAHDFIMELPNNYDYEVKERGATLSVGQRQLISFIRALVYNPKILILDEATSSVDTATENLLQEAIATLIKNRTAIVIAHRLSTIKNANHILVLDKGEIKEYGNHQSLIQIENGYYQKLYNMQFNKEKV
ncbi:MAG: ABC transporter ATP-binding protein [Chitinophagales bacterium]|nr:ABC transporter ATP-binding protein [Chitinophagales bacterium]